MTAVTFDKERLIDICRANDITMVGLFGSMARGEASETSDIDLLVKFAQQKSLLSMVKLERELSEALGRKVDLVTEPAISPYIRENILRDLEIVYAASSD